MPRRGRGRRGGFTLVEVLVAFAIAALSLAALMQVFATGLRGAATSEAYARAVMLAETRLASVGVEAPLEAGESTGRFDDDYRWRLTVEPYTEAEMDAAVEIYRIAVTVSWDEGRNAERAVTLQTLRLGPGR